MTSDIRRQTEEAVILRALQAIGAPPSLALALAKEIAERVDEARKLNAPKEDKP